MVLDIKSRGMEIIFEMEWRRRAQIEKIGVKVAVKALVKNEQMREPKETSVR